MSNPYAPPASPILAPPEPQPPAGRFSLWGILLGGVVDVVSSNIVSIPIVLKIALSEHVRALPRAEQSQAVTDALHQRPDLFALVTVLGSLCSIFAGYLAARIARRSEVANGALTAYLAVGLGLWGLAKGSGTAWNHVLSILLSPVLGAAGGYLRLRQRHRRIGPSQ